VIGTGAGPRCVWPLLATWVTQSQPNLTRVVLAHKVGSGPVYSIALLPAAASWLLFFCLPYQLLETQLR